MCLKNQQKLAEINIVKVEPYDENNDENNTFFDNTDDESNNTNQLVIKEVKSLCIAPKTSDNTLNKTSQDVEDSKPQKPKKKRYISKKTPQEVYQERMYPCTMCGKMVDRNRMEGHVNNHNGIRPFVCNIDGCVKDFFCRFVLGVHKQYTHGTFNFKCKECNKSFGTKITLKIHSLCHNDPNINCDLCGKKFKSKRIIKKHMDTHSVRNFHCKVCNQSFYRNHNLIVHERIHTKERPYKVNTSKM